LNNWNVFQRTAWWWYNIFHSGDIHCRIHKVTFLCLWFWFFLSCRNQFAPFNFETCEYCSKHARVLWISFWSLHCEPLTVRGQITTIFSYPNKERRAAHPLNLSSSLAVFFFCPYFTRGGDLFISSSHLCNIICSLFSCSFSTLGEFYMFFNILSVAVLQYSLCSSLFSWSQFLQELLTIALSAQRWPPPPPFHLRSPDVHQPSYFFFLVLFQDYVCCCFFRCCLLQMIQASALPLWIMNWDYIKTSWCSWSIFNPAHLLVKPGFLWSFHMRVCTCMFLWAHEVRRHIKKKALPRPD